MPTFRLDGRPHRVPASWAELTPAQFFAAAPHLATDSVAARVAVLRAWCPKLRPKDLRRLTPDQLWDVATLVSWAWGQELDTAGVREFSHRGTTYALPEPQLLDAELIEYAIGLIHFHQFAHPQRPQPAALDQLVATLCRPLRADLKKVQRDPLWDGMRRERYNAKLAEGRATELADAPLGVKIVVLHHFLAAQRFVHRNYKEVFKKAEAPAGPAAARPARGSDGTELLELIASLAERGLYGTYEQTAHTSLHTVLTYKAYKGQFARQVQALGWRHQVASRPPSATRGFVPVARRWVIERTFAWLKCFRRLAVDYERTPASHVAWLLVANLTMSLRRATT